MNEEEKKTIEKFIEKCYKYDESVEIKGISVGEEYRMLNTVCKALNLLEKLQKENEELRERIKQLEDTNKKLYEIGKEIGKQHKYTSENYIPVYLVEEKIEELNKAYEDSKDENGESQYYYPDYTIRVLEELLEKRE